MLLLTSGCSVVMQPGPMYDKQTMLNLHYNTQDSIQIEDALVIQSTLQFLKMTSNHYPLLASEQNKTSISNLLSGLTDMLPCSQKCRTVFEDILQYDTQSRLQELDIGSKFESRHSFRIWNCLIYNHAYDQSINCEKLLTSNSTTSILDKIRASTLTAHNGMMDTLDTLDETDVPNQEIDVSPAAMNVLESMTDEELEAMSQEDFMDLIKSVDEQSVSEEAVSEESVNDVESVNLDEL